jgi:hypothetical protein
MHPDPERLAGSRRYLWEWIMRTMRERHGKGAEIFLNPEYGIERYITGWQVSVGDENRSIPMFMVGTSWLIGHSYEDLIEPIADWLESHLGDPDASA